MTLDNDVYVTSVGVLRREGRRRAERLIWLHGLSSFCWGMVYPYTAIYLARDPGVGTSGAGLYFAGAGVANVAMALVLVIGWWRPGTTQLGILGNALSLAGYASVVAVHAKPVAVIAGVLVGMGQGAFMAAIVPTVNSLIHEADRREVFAKRYAVLAGTLAGGAMVTGLLTTVIPAERLLTWLFPLTAAGYVPLMLAQYQVRKHVRDARPSSDQTRTVGAHVNTWSPLKLLRVCAWIITFQLVAYLIGFSQIESGVPLTVDQLLDIPLVWISVMLGVNALSIVLFQGTVTRRLAKYSVRAALRAALLLWVAGYVLLALTANSERIVTIGGLLVFALIFALGECAYSCTFHPWLVGTVPDRELTRAMAMANSTMGIGMFCGPLLGVGLISFGAATTVWLGLAAIALIGIISAHGASGRRPAKAA